MLESNRFEAIVAPPAAYVQQQAFEALFLEMSDALRRRASAMCRFEQSPSFGTGDLVNTLYLKMTRNPAYALAIAARGRQEFLRVAARAMRNALYDAARRRKAQKRQGDFIFVSLSQAEREVPMTLSPEILLDLEEAMRLLEQEHPRRAAMLEMRFFAGMTVQELRDYWGVADSTVERDLTLALKVLATTLNKPR